MSFRCAAGGGAVPQPSYSPCARPLCNCRSNCSYTAQSVTVPPPPTPTKSPRSGGACVNLAVYLQPLPLPEACIYTNTHKSRSSSLCSFLHPPVTSSLFGPNILLTTLFSNTLSLCSTLNVRDQVSKPYRTAGKIIALYSLIFMFLDSRREDERFWSQW
jgi:hypothetical protein